MSRDVNLLLRRVKNSHTSTCAIVRVEADVLSALIDKFIPSILKSKVILGFVEQWLLIRKSLTLVFYDVGIIG